MPDINMQVFEEAKRNQLVTEVDIQTQVVLDDYQVQLSNIANPTQSQDNVVIDRHGEFLPHWNESLDFDTWVKMSMEIAGKRILMLRGNSSVSSESNGDNTFKFFEDGSGSVIDTNKWTEQGIGITWSIDGGAIKGLVGGSNIGYDSRLESTYSSVVNDIIHFKMNVAVGDTNAMLYPRYTDISNFITGYLQTPNYLYMSAKASGSWDDESTTLTWSTGNWYNLTITETPSNTFELKSGVATISNTVASISGNLCLHPSNLANTSAWWDNVFVCKYIATEPTWLADSEEQNIAVALKSLGRAG